MQIGKRLKTVHEEPMQPAPLFAPPVRVPDAAPLVREREPLQEAAR